MKENKLNPHQIYLSYLNDYLTIDKMAEDHNISEKELLNLIREGKKINEKIAKMPKVLIQVRGGMVQKIYSTEEVNITVIDYDSNVSFNEDPQVISKDVFQHIKDQEELSLKTF